MSFILCLIFTMLGTCFADRDDLPVLMMDYEAVVPEKDIEANPISKMSTLRFTEIIHQAVKRSEVVILFIENTLSTEDISTRDKFGTPYTHLSQALVDKKLNYYPKVVKAYHLITQIFQPQQFNVFHLSTKTNRMQLYDGRFKYFYVFFQDSANETRTETLRRHDTIVREVYFIVRQMAPGPVVAFYTGKVNPVVIKKTDVLPMVPRTVKKERGIMINSEGALFRFVDVFTATVSRRSMFNQQPVIAEQTWTEKSLSTKMAYTDFELQFNFSFKRDGWLLDTVTLLEGEEEVGRREMFVGAPWDWSYVCGDPLVIFNNRDGSSITISHYQIEPIRDLVKRNQELFRVGGPANRVRRQDDPTTTPPPESEETTSEESSTEESTGNTNNFSEAVNCGPYFTSNIIACLFVTVICLGILTYGVSTLYNCQANDRFDDPQGKGLTISAQPGG